jgi:hypothetical protein
LIFFHQVEPSLLLKALIDKSPATIQFLIDFTFAIVGAAAGTVQQPLVACGDGADARGIAQYTVTALVTNLMVNTWHVLYTYE